MLVPTSSVQVSEGSGRCAVLTISGDVGRDLVPVIRAALDELIAEGRVQIVLDVQNITFMDSAGLGVLVYGVRNSEVEKGGLRLAGAGTQVRRLLNLSGLDEVISVFPDVDAALASWAS
ncbi:STAS domain-containing protein [Streptomyces sp. NPDC049967]|uniref:STAS domain-containing protein n=1 Tax=unclassified Streptomyces TaxID=2593676 RepID=UPI002E2CB4E0|nr:STAS domain-containing protein [Streptomyces sp. NBC_00342]